MSAISGIFYRDGRSVKFEEINKLNDSMSHRGPDKSSIWIDHSVALAHQMMCTTQESLNEKLPFYDEKLGLVITADARLDNRLELADLLNIKDTKNLSDSYYILKSYEKWGENCPKYLLGDFVFVIYDKSKEKIFCARDPMGIKVFYYYLSPEKFIFATEIKAILNTKLIPLEINEERIAFYLMDINDNKSTFYKGIQVFSSATSFTIDKNKFKKEIYWKLDPKFTIILDSEEEYIAQFRELFYNAVECRLRSIRPIGFELSGGLDSSSVVCTAKKIFNKNSNFHTNLETFSCIFPNFHCCDESEYIKKVVEMGGINSNIINGDRINPLENISKILFIQEQPFFTPFMNMLWKMYERMKLNNIGVMLCGVGGDAVVSYGNKLFIDFVRENQWKKIFQELKLYSQQTNRSQHEIFLQNIIYPYVPESIKKHFRKNDVKPNSSILDPFFAKRINAKKHLEDLYWTPISNAKTSKQFHHYILNTDNLYMLEMLDRSTSFHSIEPRYPFLDKRLVEYCYGIPSEMKFKFGWSRYILRKSMDGIIPKEIQWRHKLGSLEKIYEANLLYFEKQRLNHILQTSNSTLNKFVDMNNLNKIYEQKFIKNTAEYESMDIWLSVLLYIWLKNYENNQ